MWNRRKGRWKQGWKHISDLFAFLISTLSDFDIKLFYLYLIFSHSVLYSTYNKNGWHLSYFSSISLSSFFTWNGWSSFHIIQCTINLLKPKNFISKEIQYCRNIIKTQFFFIHSNPICNKSICICPLWCYQVFKHRITENDVNDYSWVNSRPKSNYWF